MAKLVDHGELVFSFVKSALFDRVLNGDHFINFVLKGNPFVELCKVLVRVPLPTTNDEVAPSFYSSAYQSAITGRRSNFDSFLPLRTIETFMDLATSISQLTPSSWFIALIYVDRFICKCPSIIINRVNFGKIYSVALWLASKYHEEQNISMELFAQLGGCSKEEIIKLERSYLSTIDHRLYISNEDFDKAEIGLLAYVMFTDKEELSKRELIANRFEPFAEALRLKRLWKDMAKRRLIHYLSPQIAYALYHGDGLDFQRLSEACSELARVQIAREFGYSLQHLDLLIAHSELYTYEAKERLITLIQATLGVIPRTKCKILESSILSCEADPIQSSDLNCPKFQTNNLSTLTLSDMTEEDDENKSEKTLERSASLAFRAHPESSTLSLLIGSDLVQEIFGADH